MLNTNLKQRLLRRRKIIGDCWVYSGTTRDTWGYAMMRFHGKLLKVHRASASVFLGYDLNSYPELQVNHKQVCPNKDCFNPEHLYIGTNYQNKMDSVQMGTASNKYKKKRDQNGQTGINQTTT